VIVHNAGITRDKTLARMKPELWDLRRRREPRRGRDPHHEKLVDGVLQRRRPASSA
jgi:hypothetical protein